MKLEQINVGIHGSKFFNRPALHTQHLYNSYAGTDPGSRTAGSSEQPSGVPRKKRHRKYFGMLETKLSDDLYQYKLEGLKGLHSDAYIRVSRDLNDNRYIFNVYYEGRKIASFKMSGQGNYISDAEVLAPYRRKGIATKAYDFIEKYLGINLSSSPMHQTPDGIEFWKSRMSNIWAAARRAAARESY